MASEPPTQPSLVALRSVTEPELRRALAQWFVDHPIPRSLHPLLEGVVFGWLIEREEPSKERLPSWRRSFALWASMTVNQAASEVWRAAYSDEHSIEE